MTFCWKSLKGKLVCYEYWSSTDFSEWSIINFCRSLVTVDPTKPRREAIQLLKDDLGVLSAAFVDKNEHKIILGLSTALSNNKNDALNHFWHTSYPELQKNAIDHINNVNKTKANLEEEAVKESQSKKRVNTQPKTGDTKRRQVDEVTDVESDGITIPNCTVSVGTIIKREALKLHQLYLQNPKQLTERQRKIMTAGLSSILDLSDQSYSSQRTLFDDDQREHIDNYFDKKLNMKAYPLDEIIINNLTIIKSTLDLSNDFNAAKNYIGKMKIKHASNINLTSAFSIIKHILRTMSDYKKMLDNTSSTNFRENDYFRIIWSPLFELLFPPSEKIRIVSAESEYPLSIKEKKILYPKSKYVHGFKIDFRMVVDVKTEEMDLAVGECAKQNNDSKSIHDEDKLLRESKDALDGVIQSVRGECPRLMTYFIQITGTHCSLSTMELVKKGLYVSKHRHSFNFPSMISDLSELPITLGHLLLMKKEINISADKILQAHTSSTGGEESFNRPPAPKKNKKLGWMRDTWYTPPKEKTSQIPVHMFTPPKPPSFAEPKNDSSDEETAVVGAPDKFGWIKYAENDYFNVFSKESSTEHPYE